MKFGDYVVLLGTAQSQIHGKISGLLSGVGFTDDHVFFQKLPAEPLNQAMKQSFSIGTKKDQDQVNPLSFINNHNDCVYQVWPKLGFDAHKEYRKKVKEKDKVKSRMKEVINQSPSEPLSVGISVAYDQEKKPFVNLENNQINFNQVAPTLLQSTIVQENKSSQQQLLESLENKISQLQKSCEDEKQINMSQLAMVMGEQVTFGRDIQFLHVSSQKFLNGKIIASEVEKSAYSFRLSDSFSGGMIFRLLPKFKLRQIGEGIQYNDMIVILNSKLNCYINFFLDSPIETDRKIEGNPKYLLPQPEVRYNDQKTPRYEAYLSLFSDTSWQVIKHGKGIQEENENGRVVRGEQIIKFKHTESGLQLAAGMPFLGENPEVHLRLYTGAFLEEKLSVQSLLQLETDTPFHRGAHLHFQNKDGTPRYLRLRHLITGRFLGTSDVKVGGVIKKTFVLLKNEDLKLGSAYDLATRVVLEPTITVHQNISVRYQQCYHILIGGLYLKTMTNPDYVTGKSSDKRIYLRVQSPKKIDGFYQQLSDVELGVDRTALEFVEKKSEEDAFWIEPLSIELQQQIGFITSTIPSILRFFHHISDKRQDVLTPEYLRSFLGILSQVIEYIQNKDQSDKPSLQRQLRNCNYIDYLTMILYTIFKNGFIDTNNFKKASKEILQIVQECYTLIRVIIQDYKPNELYAAQWIDLIMEQSMIQDKYFDSGAGKTLTELIDNNRFVLENKIQPNTINRFLDELLKTKQIKYLRLLRALINCDGAAMVGSQSQISERVLTQENQNILIPTFDFDGLHVKISIMGTMMDLEDLKTESESLESSTSFNYFVNLIEFLSDLCLDKNFLAIPKLQKVFTLPLCKFIIKGLIYPPSIRAAFTKLTITLWIEGGQLQKLQLPNFVRAWDQISLEDEEVKVLSHRSSEEFSDFKGFIQQHMVNEQDRIFQRAFLEEENYLTYNILQLCYSLLTYGLYQDLNDIQQLVQPLISYLNGCNDVTSPDEEAAKLKLLIGTTQGDTQRSGKMSLRFQKSSIKQFEFKSRYKDNELTKQLSKSRTLICEIIHYFNLLVLDIRATLFLKEFKREQENIKQEEQNEKDQQQKGLIMGGLMNFTKGLQKVTKIIPMSLDDLNPLNLFFKSDMDDPDLIPLIWMNKVLALQNYEILKNDRNQLISIKIDLVMYENVDLVSQAFTLLNENYSHKILLLNYLKDIQLIDDPFKVRLFEEVKQIRKNLLKLADNSEDWWDQNNEEAQQTQKQVRIQVERLYEILILPPNLAENGFTNKTLQQQSNNVLRKHYELEEDEEEKDTLLIAHSQPIKPLQSQLSPIHQIKGTKEHPNYLLGIVEKDVRNQIRKEFQKMMSNLHLEKPLLQLISYDLQMSKGDDKKDEKQKIKVLQIIYRFLAYFCFENIENKSLLTPSMKQFRQHLETKNVYAHLVLQEVYRNNRNILMNKQKLNKIVLRLCRIIETLSFNDPLKVVLLDSLNIFMRIEGRVHKPNQVLVLNRLGDLKGVLLDLNQQAFQDNFFAIAQNFSKQLELRAKDSSESYIQVPLEIDYMLVQLKVMATAAEDKNTGAESRCQAIFPFKKIYTILKNTNKCWPLRHGFVRFYYDVFLDTEKETEDPDGYNPLIIEEIINDMQYIADSLEWLQKSRIEMITFQNYVRLRKLLRNYVIDLLLPLLSFVVKSNLIYSYKNHKMLYSKLVEVLFQFSVFNDKIMGTAICRLLQYIENNKKINNDIDYINKFKINLPQSYQSILQGDKQKLKQNATRYHSAISNADTSLPMEKGLNIILMEKLEKLSKHKVFNKQVEEEIEQMVDQIMDIEQITKNHLKTVTITWEAFMGKVVRLIDSRSDPKLPNRLVMVGFKVFRKIVEKANPDQINPAADWTFDEYAKYEKKIREQQNRLINLGIIDVIGSTIQMDTSIEIKQEAILVAVSILLSGNQLAQQAFEEFFEKDKKNLFILKIYEMLDGNFNIIKKYSDRKIKDRDYFMKYKDLRPDDSDIEEENELIHDQFIPEKQGQDGQKLKDNEEEEDKNDAELDAQQLEKFELNTINNNKRLIRLLQLFCEGQNNKLQNYLRVQTQRGEANGKSINIVQYMAFKFGTLVKSLCIENMGLIKQIADFLVDSIHGPCFPNQECLASSKIIDVCAEVLLMFQDENEQVTIPEQEKQNIFSQMQKKMFSHLNEGFSDFKGLFVQKKRKEVKMTIEQQRRGFQNSEQFDGFHRIASSSTMLLLGLLEGATNASISKFMQESLELEHFRFRMCRIYNEFVTDTLELPVNEPLYVVIAKTQDKVKFFEGKIADALKLYVLITTMADQLKDEPNNKAQEVLQNYRATEIEQNALEFFRLSTGSVEVFFKDALVKVFFPIDPTCKNLSVLSRRLLMQEVKRDSPNDKINGLVDAAPTLFTEMHHMSFLKKLPFQFTATRLSFFRDLSTVLALLINLVLIFSYKRGVVQIGQKNITIIEGGQLFNGKVDSSYLIFALGLTQLVTSSLMLTFWVIINTPVILKAQWNNFLQDNKLENNEKIENEIYDVNRDPTKYTTVEISYIFRTKGPYSAFFERANQRFFGSLFAKILYYIKSFIFLCSDQSFIYMFFYISVSIIAVAQSEILYSFHLLDIIGRFETLKNVVRAVTQNFKQLALTFFLMSIITYIYSLVTYYFFPEAFNDSVPQMDCGSIFQCFLAAQQYGLRNGGGIAENLLNPSYHENFQEMYYLRVIYDISFFTIITTLLLNMVSGIIIDSFAELRDEKNQMIEDMNSKCYICNMDRYEFERNTDGFEHHIEEEHNLWNYVYYMHYLDKLNVIDRNGIESYCINKMESYDIGWFPIMKAMSLNNGVEEETFAEKFQKELFTINKSMQNFNKKIAAIDPDEILAKKKKI